MFYPRVTEILRKARDEDTADSRVAARHEPANTTLCMQPLLHVTAISHIDTPFGLSDFFRTDTRNRHHQKFFLQKIPDSGVIL